MIEYRKICVAFSILCWSWAGLRSYEGEWGQCQLKRLLTHLSHMQYGLQGYTWLEEPQVPVSKLWRLRSSVMKCVCVCVFMHVCVCVFMHIWVCVCVPAHVCMCLCVYIYIYIYIYIYTHTYMYAGTCTLIYAWTHTHTHTYIYIYIYILKGIRISPPYFFYEILTIIR